MQQVHTFAVVGTWTIRVHDNSRLLCDFATGTLMFVSAPLAVPSYGKPAAAESCEVEFDEDRLLRKRLPTNGSRS